MGPPLLSPPDTWNETQEGVPPSRSNMPMRKGCRCSDLADLQPMPPGAWKNADLLSARYGNVTEASVGAIQRQLLQLDSQGGSAFFGEPALDIHDMLESR